MKTFCANTLLLWFENLIPSLLPFMILSNIIIQMHWEHIVVRILMPFLKPLFRIHAHGIYVIVSGFLFGFPMGAKVIGQLYSTQKITRHEASWLLSFCNHLSPIYCITFIAPLLQLSGKETGVFLSIFYGIPLLWGIMLRHTYYKKKIARNDSSYCHGCREYGFTHCLDRSITDALISIAKMGGYMMFLSAVGYLIQSLFLYLRIAEVLFKKIFPLIEISSGLSYYVPDTRMALFYLTFGGVSCILQTRSMLQHTDLSIRTYLLHKMIHSFMAVFFAHLFCIH